MAATVLRFQNDESAPQTATSVVKFYETEAFFNKLLFDYVTTGLNAGEGVFVIATSEHVSVLVSALIKSGREVEELEASGQLVITDPESVLTRLTVNAKIDRQRFLNVIGNRIEQMAHRPAVRIFAELADVLWREGRIEDLRELEELWPSVITERVTLLRAFSLPAVSSVVQGKRFSEVVGTHSSFEEGELPTKCGRDVALLQLHSGSLKIAEKRVQHLECEIEKSQAELARTKLQADKAARAKGVFLSNMTHGMRTPLTSIIGFAEILADDARARGADSSFAESIYKNGQRLLSVITDVLTVADLNTKSFELNKVPTLPTEVIHQVEKDLRAEAEAKGLSITTSFDGDALRRIQTDPALLAQAMTYLVSNAIKFTDQGGIHLQCRLLKSRRLKLEILVKDTGTGIAAESCAELFEPFTQIDPSLTKEHQGSGLGLFLAKKSAEALGGDVDLYETELGKGSTFRLVIDGGSLL